MIGNQYKIHRDNAIDIFDGYKGKRSDLEDGVDIKFLENRIELLKKGKYLLAVAGEVKAGKSTFINAFLGTEILPADVLQTSNAIVEISKSESPFLKIKYADGHEENTDRIEKLPEICRISDIYREIPTTIIDEYITESSLEVTKDLIEEWENKANVKLKGKEEVLNKYINERTKDKIPIEIELGYPLKSNFDELRIVDTPGVNASRELQNLSFDFLEKANAILFIHPITPVESESLKKFINSVITNRSKEALFLILTHAGFYIDSDIAKLHKEAIRLYENDIPEERILVVDSLLKLIHDDLVDKKTMEQIEKSERKKDILPKFEKKANSEKKKLEDILLEYSRFDQMYEVMDEFLMKAPNLQITEIIETIKKGYENQDSQYVESIELYEKKKRNPQEFEAEINRILKALSEYKSIMLKAKEDLHGKNTGIDAFWNKDFNGLKLKYPELITKSNTFVDIRKNSFDAYIEMKEIADGFSRSFKEDLDSALKQAGETFKEEYKITPPGIDLDSIENEAKANGVEIIKKTRIEGIFENWNILKLKWTKASREVSTGETEQIFNQEKALGNLRDMCYSLFFNNIKEFTEGIKKYIESYLNLFERQMNYLIDERQKTLQDLKDQKLENDEIINEINNMKKKREELIPQLKRAEEVLYDIK